MRFLPILAVLWLLPGCKSDEAATPPDAPAASPDAGSDAGPGPGPDDGPAWKPGVRYPTERSPGARGLLDRRGLIHAHSAYSHDACDGQPHDDAGAYDQGCFGEFRKGLCDQQMDFVMVSDHRDSFARNEFPEVLLFRPAEGDTLIERGGAPVANRLACPGRDPVVLLAGTESGTMPVGLERHLPGTPDERYEAYGGTSAEAIAAYKPLGAVNLMQHTEDWSVEQLTTLPIDGFEMFNLHANAYLGAGALIGLLKLLKNDDPGLPHPDLVILPAISEDPVYLATWGSVLARGAHRVTTMGTDCHRNSFPQILPDGERIDSYRRMMGWFSNHLLVRPEADGSWDDASLKQALSAGRLYGAFEVLGTPVGFDYLAVSADDAPHEMGETVSVSSGITLNVTVPRVSHLDPAAEPPALTARILRAREGGWDVITSSAQSISLPVADPGVYRAEIRMTPRHLASSLGDYADSVGRNGDMVWIYSNAIYVTP
jgi:hypothetical protein